MLAESRPCPRFDLPAPDVAEATALAVLLADRTRAGILALLRDGPHCVCEFAAALGVHENNVSNHLAKLRDAGLVRSSRHGGDARWVYYERDAAAIAAAVRAITDVLGSDASRAATTMPASTAVSRRRARAAGPCR